MCLSRHKACLNGNVCEINEVHDQDLETPLITRAQVGYIHSRSLIARVRQLYFIRQA